jgi:hypothetical protein
VCLRALNLLFVVYYHHVYERGRSSENMNPGPVLSIRKFPSYFYDVLLAGVKPENHETLVTHFAFLWFCKFARCWYLTTTIVSFKCKDVCLLL